MRSDNHVQTTKDCSFTFWFRLRGLSSCALRDNHLLQVFVAERARDQKATHVPEAMVELPRELAAKLSHRHLLLNVQLRVGTGEDEEEDGVLLQLSERYQAGNLIGETQEGYPPGATPAPNRNIQSGFQSLQSQTKHNINVYNADACILMHLLMNMVCGTRKNNRR